MIVNFYLLLEYNTVLFNNHSTNTYSIEIRKQVLNLTTVNIIWSQLNEPYYELSYSSVFTLGNNSKWYF